MLAFLTTCDVYGGGIIIAVWSETDSPVLCHEDEQLASSGYSTSIQVCGTPDFWTLGFRMLRLEMQELSQDWLKAETWTKGLWESLPAQAFHNIKTVSSCWRLQWLLIGCFGLSSRTIFMKEERQCFCVQWVTKKRREERKRYTPIQRLGNSWPPGTVESTSQSPEPSRTRQTDSVLAWEVPGSKPLICWFMGRLHCGAWRRNVTGPGQGDKWSG